MNTFDGYLKKMKNLSVLLLTGVLSAACSSDVDYLNDILGSTVEEDSEILMITGVQFSDDYKTFHVDARLKESIGTINLADPDEVTVTAGEYDNAGNPAFVLSQPVLTGIERLGAAQVVAHDLKMLVLVDLSLPQSVVDMERDAVREMSAIFTNDNLFVSFITRKHEVSEMMVPSKYVLENYFKSVDVDETNLFPSISRGLGMLSDENGPFSDVSERVLLVLSDGNIFSDDTFSFGEGYFKEKEELLTKSVQTQDTHLLFFVDIYDNEDVEPEDIDSFMASVCRNTGGKSYHGFDWIELEEDIFSRLQIDYSDYRFNFENPSGKEYVGLGKTLRIECFKDGELVAKGSAPIREGSYFYPVIVDRKSEFIILISGIILSFSIIYILLLVLQLIVPYVKYRIFKRRYTARFTDPNMSLNGIVVGDSCYYCKAPFVPGEEIVAKCKHTMHKSCWDENGYHCPEYGRNCKDGSHFYNSSNKLDLRNAPYYMKWILAAMVSGTLIWLLLILIDDIYVPKRMVAFFEANGVPIEKLSSLFPLYGFLLSFVLTVFFCAISTHRIVPSKRVAEVLVRALVSGLVSYIAFTVNTLVAIVIDDVNLFYLVDWIPWALSSLAIAYCSTFRTNFTVRFKSLLIVIMVSVALMLLWDILITRLSLDSRLFWLVALCLYALGIASGLAQAEPRSERYFLHASGAIKEMDIALYKWFASDPSAVVSIGKSVDCSLEMSWDIAPGIGPRQAEIRLLRGTPYLYAVDNGVRVKNRNLRAGEKMRLYHGRMFRIGNTEFVYQERDI